MRYVILLLAAAATAAAAPPATGQDKTAREAPGIGDEIDAERLLREKAYAEQVLAQIEALRKSDQYSGDLRGQIDRLRMLALIGSDRLQDAFSQATQLTKAYPGDPSLHYTAFLLGVETGSDRTLEELEAADRSIVSKKDRATFREALQTDTVAYFRRPFFIAKDKDRIGRSAQTLLNFEWPGPLQLEYEDRLRLDVADRLLVRGDQAGAKKLVFALRTASPVLETLIVRKWDPIRDTGDPAERLAQSIAASDEATRQAHFEKPDDLELLLRRAQFLRSVGKEAEALQLMLPKTENLEWIKEQGEDAYWIANEASYALIALKREKEAVTLMERLLSISLAENPMLISMAINSIGVRIDAGDFRGAADYAELLATRHADMASPYGDMWMWEGAVCAHTHAGSPDRAGPWLAKLKAGEKDNPAALTRALLCVNDLDGAAASVIRRLNGDDPEDMLKALQDYTIGPDLPRTRKLLEDRLREVIARPGVQAAIASKGRLMKVPLSRIYWGMF